MAFREMRNLRYVLSQLEPGKRSLATSTVPKMKPMAPAVQAHQISRKMVLKAEFAPIYIIFGMVGVAGLIGIHTTVQQLGRSPTVHVNKKKRESFPEVENPDETIGYADRFINKSFLRKLAHIQDQPTSLNDPVHPNPFTRPRTAETLKTVGVNPERN